MKNNYLKIILLSITTASAFAMDDWEQNLLMEDLNASDMSMYQDNPEYAQLLQELQQNDVVSSDGAPNHEKHPNSEEVLTELRKSKKQKINHTADEVVSSSSTTTGTYAPALLAHLSLDQASSFLSNGSHQQELGVDNQAGQNFTDLKNNLAVKLHKEKCPNCLKEYDKSYLPQHRAMVHEICVYCTKDNKFSDRKAISEHFKTQHPDFTTICFRLSYSKSLE